MLRTNKRYSIFFLIILALFVLQKIITVFYFSTIPPYGELINEAGRQRMRSQKFSKEIFAGSSNPHSDSSYYLNTIETFIKWENSYDSLLLDTYSLRNNHSQLDSLFNLNRQLIDSIQNKFVDTTISEASLYDLVKLEQDYLSRMDSIVNMIEQLSKSNVDYVENIDLIISIAFIILLSLLFYLMVIPVNKSLADNNSNLMLLNEKLQFKEKELSTNLSQLSSLQREVERSEHLKEIFIDQAPIPIAMFDRSGGVIEASMEWINEYGLNRDQLEGLNFFDIGIANKEFWQKAFEEAIGGDSKSGTGQKFVNTKGEYFWIDWEMRPWYLNDNEIGGAVFYFQDISDRQQLELESSRLQKNMEMTNIAAVIGSWEYHIQEEKVSWSDVTKQIHEVPIDYTPNLNSGIQFYKEGKSKEAISSAVQKAIEKGKGWDLELQIVTYTGNEKWVRTIGMAEFVDGFCVRLYGTFQDIHKSKSLELENKKEALKMENLLKGTNAGTWEWNIKHDRLICNEKWAEILGYKLFELEPITYKTWQDLIHPDDLARKKKLLQQYFDSMAGFYEAEIRMKHKSGHWVWVFSRGKVFSWSDAGEPEVMYGTHIDISRNKDRQLQFESFITQSPSAIAMLDLQLKFIAVSDKWREDFKLVNKIIIGQNLLDTLPNQSDKWQKSLETALEGIRNSIKTEDIIIADGSKKVFNWEMKPWYLNGKLRGIIIHTEDVTEKLKIEAEKMRIQSVMDLTNNIVRVGVWEYDLTNQDVFWSEVTKEIHEVPYSYQPDLNSVTKFFEIEDNKSTFQRLIKEAETEGRSFDVELQIKTAENNTMWVRLIGRPIFENGKCQKIIGIYMDVDDVYRYNNQDVIIKKNRLEKANNLLKEKNRRLKDFTQITSHNLRAPISNLGALVALFNVTEDDNYKQEVINKLQSVTTHLEDTLNVLMDSLKLQETDVNKIEKVELSFQEIYDKTLNSMSTLLINNNVTISSDFSKLEKIEYYPLYLESIMHNLVSNGIKYRDENKSSFVHVETYVLNNQSYLKVSDNGLGIDMQKYGDKLFGLNKTFHKVKGAQGIGLFITKQQVELLGGDISAKSKEGVGTSFFVRF